MELNTTPPPSPVRRKHTMRRKHAYDLTIIHTQDPDDVAWANYLKSELQQRRQTDSRITLISEVNFIPRPADEVRRIVSNSCSALLIVTPALLTLFNDDKLVFDLIDPENMAAVLFYCGVEESTAALRRKFPNYDKWSKLTAKCSDEDLLGIFDFLIKIIDDHNAEPQPEQEAARKHLKSPSHSSRHRQRRRVRTNRKDTWIYPDRGRCDQPTRTCVVFREDLPENCNLQVELRGQSSHTNKRLDTIRINGSTFEFTIPEGVCEELKLGFTRDGTCVAVGTFHYESPLDDIDPTMQLMLSCMDAICQDINIESLDKKLHRIFAADDNSHIPARAFEQLFSLYEYSIKADCSMYPLPSLLHFVAKYGLQDLAATIVGLPGADQAYSLPNARGHTPLDLARMHGHTDLYAFLHDYFDTLNKEDAIYDVIQKMIHSEKNGELNSDPLDQTVRPPTQEHLGGESYWPMTGSTGSPPHSVEEDLYLPMIPGVPSQPSSKSPSKEPSLEDVVPVMGHDPQDFSDRDSYIHMQDSTEDPPVPLDDDLPSIDLPSPIPLSPRDIEPAYRPRKGTLEKTGHVVSTDFPDNGSGSPPSREPINPFPFELLGPDEQIPEGSNNATDVSGQDELLEILKGFKDQTYTISEVERRVDDWKQRNENKRSVRTFKEKKREIKVQQEIVNNSLKSVEEQLPKSNQGIIKNLMNRIRNGKKITKNHSAPVKSKTAPTVDMSRIQAASSMAAQSGQEEENPVCDSLPDLPPSHTSASPLDAENNRFSTISNSSSSSAASGFSHGSTQDSGIEVNKRDELPLRLRHPRKLSNNANPVLSVYDVPPTPPVQLPILPNIRNSRSTSDEGSGYEDMDNWINPNQDSVKKREESEQSPTELHIEPDPEAPPLPPRTRRVSTQMVTEFLAKSPAKSKLPAPKAPGSLGRRSVLKSPAIPPKPKPKGNMYSSSENVRREGGAGPTVTRSTSKVSQVPRPTHTRPQQNYSNVVIDLQSAFKHRSRMQEPQSPVEKKEEVEEDVDEENEEGETKENGPAPELPPRKK